MNGEEQGYRDALVETRKEWKAFATAMHSRGLHDFGRWIDERCATIIDARLSLIGLDFEGRPSTRRHARVMEEST
jgi:hypothetical protein